MVRFFARFLALILSAALLLAALAVLVHVRPQGLAGWLVMAGLVAGAFLAPVWLYRALMGRAGASAPRDDEGEGAGIAVGMGLDQQRQRREDGDDDLWPGAD